jgi:hypothetical protein
MNNAELDKLLKAAPVPERPADYWEDFPRQVLAGLPREPRRPSRTEAPIWRRLTLARLTFAVTVVTACFLIGFSLGSRRHRVPSLTARELATARTYLREMEALFPNQVQAVVFEEAGPRLVLAERADVPAGQPVFVRVTGPDGTRGFLTFSGQHIRLNGEAVEVLVTGRGQVLLVGASLAWSSADNDASAGPWRIAARPLKGTT